MDHMCTSTTLEGSMKANQVFNFYPKKEKVMKSKQLHKGIQCFLIKKVKTNIVPQIMSGSFKGHVNFMYCIRSVGGYK